MSATAFQRKRRELVAIQKQIEQENQFEKNDLSTLKKDELINLAKKQRIEGCTKMTKEQLLKALQDRG